MKNLLKVIVALPALLFLVMGLRWLVDPGAMAQEFGFVLAEGMGLSAQVGDFGAFFITLGACMLLGVVSGNRLWYYPAIMLLLLAAIGRLLAWGVHGASFAASELAIEVVVAALLFGASRWLPDKD